MKTSSCKAKGRSLQNLVATELNKMSKERFDAEAFYPAIMGESGKDIKMDIMMATVFPWDVECKNQENWSIPQWWKQAVANTEEGRKPLLVIKKNRQEPLVVMRFSDWLELL